MLFNAPYLPYPADRLLQLCAGEMRRLIKWSQPLEPAEHPKEKNMEMKEIYLSGTFFLKKNTNSVSHQVN
jgi:hypothetical protein